MTTKATAAEADLSRLAAGLSISYVVAMAGEMLHAFPLDFLDLLLVFTITGVLSGLAGLMFASRFGYVNPVSTGSQMELIVISAVVIGGTNVFGGSGSVLGVILGCLLLGLVNVGLPMLGVSAFWQLALYGLAILLAATVDTLIQRRAGGIEELA